MPRKWEVTKAVRSSSDLPMPARTIMFVLADISEAGTAEVPERFTPSLEVLARECGMGRSTAAEHIKLLEAKGWLTREVMPSGRNRYRLLIPWAPDAEPLTVQDRDPSGGGTGDLVEQSSSRTADVVDESSSRMVNSPGAGLPYKEATPEPDQDPSSSAKPPRPDVERICQHLADRMVANGCKPPTIGHRWREAARLLLDKDGRTEDQVIAAIDWATADPFWQANILSLPTLRAKYEQLRLAAKRKREAANGRASPDQNRQPATYHQLWQPED